MKWREAARCGELAQHFSIASCYHYYYCLFYPDALKDIIFVIINVSYKAEILKSIKYAKSTVQQAL